MKRFCFVLMTSRASWWKKQQQVINVIETCCATELGICIANKVFALLSFHKTLFCLSLSLIFPQNKSSVFSWQWSIKGYKGEFVISYFLWKQISSNLLSTCVVISLLQMKAYTRWLPASLVSANQRFDGHLNFSIATLFPDPAGQ